MFKIIKKSEYRTTKWSGGETTELFIYPVDSEYKALNFDIRISLASVEVDSSNFTPLSGVNRILTVLEGTEHSLKINSEPFQTLEVLNPIHFSGEDDVKSTGKALNFNVMLSTDLNCSVDIIKPSSSPFTIDPNGTNLFCYLYKGFQCEVNDLEWNEGDSLLCNNIISIKTPPNSILVCVGF